MRFLVREQTYENPVASGRLRYRVDGDDTGALETWRLNDAVDGYRLLRIDLDGRKAQSRDSYLYHLLLDPDGQPERLTYRFWGGDGHKVEGNLFFEGTQVICGRTVNGARVADIAVDRSDPLIWWFPAAVSVHTFAALDDGSYEALWLDREADLALKRVTVTVEHLAEATLTVMNRPVHTRQKRIAWLDEERIAWFDEHQWPIKVQHNDLTATEIRYVRRNRLAAD